MKLRISS